MINIRKGIFETNSSSTHSLCIQTKAVEKIPNYVYFNVNDFGWEVEKHYNYWHSVSPSYLYTALLNVYKEDSPELNDWLNYIKTTLEKYDCQVDFEQNPYKEYSNGYKFCVSHIDHANELIPLLNELRNNEDKLIRFLFGEDTFILTGNDNGEEFEILWEHYHNEEGFDDKYEVFEKGN